VTQSTAVAEIVISKRRMTSPIRECPDYNAVRIDFTPKKGAVNARVSFKRTTDGEWEKPSQCVVFTLVTENKFANLNKKRMILRVIDHVMEEGCSSLAMSNALRCLYKQVRELNI
jgi:hypothetical protein